MCRVMPNEWGYSAKIRICQFYVQGIQRVFSMWAFRLEKYPGILQTFYCLKLLFICMIFANLFEKFVEANDCIKFEEHPKF